jgi:hypothetical protein
VEALTPEIAGLLLGEPRLGRPAVVTTRRGGPTLMNGVPGKRWLKLAVRKQGGLKLTEQRSLNVRTPRSPVVVRADLTITPPRLMIDLRLSEREALEILDLLTRTEGADLPSALRKVQQIHQPSLKLRLVACLRAHRSLGLDDAATQAAAEQLVTGVDAGLSTLFQNQSTELAAAIRDQAEGIRITLTFSGVTREGLQGTLPPPTAAVVPGFSRG